MDTSEGMANAWKRVLLGSLMLAILGTAVALASSDGTPLPFDVLPPQAQTEVDPRQGQIFDPPEPGYQPAVSAEDALALALDQGVIPDDPSAAEAKLVLLTTMQPPVIRIPTWVVSFADVCIPFRGPVRADVPPGACAGTTWNVLVDAETGAVIAEYGSGHLTVPPSG